MGCEQLFGLVLVQIHVPTPLETRLLGKLLAGLVRLPQWVGEVLLPPLNNR